MKRFMIAMALLASLMVSAPKPAAAVSAETMAYTFALTLGGTVAGAYLFPYVVPTVAPVVSASYSAVAGAVNGTLTTVGSYVVWEPRMVGAITGMAAGLTGGLVFFADEEVEVETPVKETSNSAIKLKR